MYVVWSTRAQTHRTQTRSSSLSGHRSAQNPVPSTVSPNYIAAKDRDNDTRNNVYVHYCSNPYGLRYSLQGLCTTTRYVQLKYGQT